MGSETRFLAPVRAALERLRPPAAGFQPQGEWEHTYAVLQLTPERAENGEHPQAYGKLRLTRKPADSGRFRLDVDFAIDTRARAGMHTRASMLCTADRLATPQRWELHSDTVEAGSPVAALSVSESATVRGGVIVRTGLTSRSAAAPRAFTSNWSLLEAVQRLPFDSAAPIEFDMFEDLDLHKPGQSLHAVGTVTVRCADGAMRLHGFRQTGRGVLPIHYWLDSEHRLILAEGSLRAFLWDGGAPAGKRS